MGRDFLPSTIPTRIGTDSDWSDIIGGGYHSIGQKSDGALWIWGGNDVYQLGLGDTFNRTKPAQWGSSTPPTLLSASLISGPKIDLSWSDNSNNETGFIIERKNSYIGTYEPIATVNTNVISYSDTDISGLLMCYYRVKSYNAYGESSYSNDAYIIIAGNWSSAISAGGIHTIARKTNGTIWSWGNGQYGQLGLGDGSNRRTPSQIWTDTDWVSVSAGSVHTVLRKTNNTLWVCGRNNYGQLGLGYTSNSVVTTPSQLISTDSDWIVVKSGCSHNIALKSNGTIWTWGRNNKGQIGDNTVTNRTTPREIGTDSDWSIVNGGYYYTMAIKTNNTLWTWGDDDYGQLGLGFITPNMKTPCLIGSDSDWINVAGGREHTIALKTNGTIWSWGGNGYGQLGLGHSSTRTTPCQIDTNTDWVTITTGYKYSLALKTNGTIWSWGNNNYGQLGLGDIGINRNTPTQIGSDSNWYNVTAGGESDLSSHTIAKKTNGTLWAWGNNYYGQLGLGDTIDRNEPALIVE